MEYASVVQKLRLVQAVLLIFSAVAIYSEADQIGLSLLPFTLIFGHLFVILNQWRQKIDGRYDFEGMLTSNGSLHAQVHYAVQTLSPFVFSLLLHFSAPVIPSPSSATVFNLSHYFTVAAAAIVLLFDGYGGMIKKIS